MRDKAQSAEVVTDPWSLRALTVLLNMFFLSLRISVVLTRQLVSLFFQYFIEHFTNVPNVISNYFLVHKERSLRVSVNAYLKEIYSLFLMEVVDQCICYSFVSRQTWPTAVFSVVVLSWSGVLDAQSNKTFGRIQARGPNPDSVVESQLQSVRGDPIRE